MYPITQNQTSIPLVFLLVSSTDHITGQTGKTPTVKLCKPASASPTVFATPVLRTIVELWILAIGLFRAMAPPAESIAEAPTAFSENVLFVMLVVDASE